MKRNLTIGLLIALGVLVAIALVATPMIPFETKTVDGNTSRYNLTLTGQRKYFSLIGNDVMGARIEVKVKEVPGYAQVKSFYPDGALREESEMYVEAQSDGLKLDSEKILSGTFYMQDGTVASKVADGTGTATITNIEGKLFRTAQFEQSKIVQMQTFRPDGKLLQEVKRSGTTSEEINYFPNGKPRSVWIYEDGKPIESKHFDREGNPVPENKA